MDKLDSNKKYLDKETFNLYNKVKKESIDLVNTIEKAEETDSRIALKNVFELIREIFSKKSSSSESDKEKKRVIKNTKRSPKKHVERTGYKRGVSPEIENVKNIVEDTSNILKESKKPGKKSSEEGIANQYIPPRYFKKQEDDPNKQGGKGLKIMTPDQILTRLPILLTQKKAGTK